VNLSFVGSLEAEGGTGGWVGLESILAGLTVNDGGTMGFVSVFKVQVGWTGWGLKTAAV